MEVIPISSRFLQELANPGYKVLPPPETGQEPIGPSPPCQSCLGCCSCPSRAGGRGPRDLCGHLCGQKVLHFLCRETGRQPATNA
jgi:hypothetical protein